MVGIPVSFWAPAYSQWQAVSFREGAFPYYDETPATQTNPCFDYIGFFPNLKFSTKKFFRIFLIGVTSSDPIQMDLTANYG